MMSDLFEDLSEALGSHLLQGAMKLLDTLLLIGSRVGMRYDRNIYALLVFATTGNLCRVTRAEFGISRESEAC